jgi:hypothetical protein
VRRVLSEVDCDCATGTPPVAIGDVGSGKYSFSLDSRFPAPQNTPKSDLSYKVLRGTYLVAQREFGRHRLLSHSLLGIPYPPTRESSAKIAGQDV